MIELPYGKKYWLYPQEEKLFMQVCRGHKNYVEIGTMHGGSACAAGAVMTGEIHCIDPFYKCSPDDVALNWQANGLDTSRLHVYVQEHPPWPAAIKRKKFDVGYIDGNHEYDHVMADWLAMKKRARIVMFHDVWVKPRSENYKLMQGAEVAPSQVFNRILEEDTAWEFVATAGRLGVIRRVR